MRGRWGQKASGFFELDSETAVRVAYQVILAREPDDAGLAAYRAQIDAGTLSYRALCEALLASPEFTIRWHTRIWADRRAAEGDEPVVAQIHDGPSIRLAPWDLLISDVIRATGVWEPQITRLVRSLVQPGSLFVDVGANVGYFALLAAHLVGPAGRVVAVEPGPTNLQLLLGSVVDNGYEHLDVWPLAFSDRRAVLPLRTDDVSTNATLVPSAEAAGATWVVAVPGDELLAGLPTGVPCVLKVDVEGHEHQVLVGLARFLERHRPTAILECNPRFIADAGGDAGEQLAWLFATFPSVGVLDGDEIEPLAGPDDVVARWRHRNEAAGQDGVLHLDLVARW